MTFKPFRSSDNIELSGMFGVSYSQGVLRSNDDIELSGMFGGSYLHSLLRSSP